MALQVWLPLNGNLLNKGCSSLTFSALTTNTATNTSGKIGSCYGNNSYTAGGLCSDTTISLGQKQSMFCWFKFTSLLNSSSLGGALVSQHRHTTNSGMGITIRRVSDSTGYLSVNTGNGSSRTYNTYYGTTLLQANTWYHGGYTYDGSTIRIYVNGVCEKEQAYTGMSVPADYITAFCWSFNASTGSAVYGNYKLNGYLNDVRVYDHCLSLAEIKELAKGLCVHYKLDTPSSISNLVRNTSYNVYNNYASAGFTGTLTNTGRTYNSCKIYRLTYTPGSDTSKLNNVKSSLFNHGIYGFGRTFLANTKYCFWILCKPISHPDTVVGGTASNISGWTEIPMKKYDDDWFIVGQCRKGNVTENKTDSIYTSFKTPSAEAGVPITIDFCCPHLVEGSDSILPEYDYVGTDPGIVDSSGYSNHGTKNGTLSLSSDTARYGMSTNFNNSGYIINSAFNLKSNAFTMNLWVNPRTTTAQHFLFGSFSTWPNNGLGVYRDAGSNTRYQCVIRSDGESTYSAKTITVTLNTWNMLTITYSGTVYTGYVNGEKSFEVTYGASGIVSHYNIMIGNSKFNNTPASENEEALVSDFRLYATCLSADDIKRLYEVSASVSKNGAMLGYEMKES